MFNILEIDEEIIAHYPTELIGTDFKTYLLDGLSLVKSGKLINLEFHSSHLSDEDLERYFQYARSAFYEHGLEVESHIVLFKDMDENIRYYKIINNQLHPFYLHSLKKYNGEEILNVVEEKLKTGEDITDEEMLLLILAGFTSFNMAIEELLVKSAILVEKLVIFDDEEKEYIKGIIEQVYRTVTGQEVEGELKEVLRMGPTILEEILIEYGEELENKFLLALNERDKELNERDKEISEIKRQRDSLIYKLHELGVNEEEINQVTNNLDVFNSK